jgi:DNA-binding Lrp family transcriptional regulator
MENSVSVFIGVVTEEKMKTSDIVPAVMGIAGVSDVWELTGSYDMLVLVKSSSIRQLNLTVEEIRACKGVVQTTTYLVLDGHSKSGRA